MFLIAFCAFLIPLLCNAAELPITIIIPSYNNAKWYDGNLNSVFKQQYKNYHIIYIDDCSTDNTANLVQKYAEQRGFSHKLTLIRNSTRRGALYNIYQAVHSCNDDNICITVDGDDALAHEQVLSRINSTYDDNTWLTYGSYKTYPENQRGARQIPPNITVHNYFREYDWCSSHLRTFRAWLFKQIPLQELIIHGREFFPVTWDMAFMFPMLEMSGRHSKFIDEILYLYNVDTPLNDFKLRLVEQLHCDRLIRSKPKFSCCDKPHIMPQERPTTVTAIVIGENKTQHLNSIVGAEYTCGVYGQALLRCANSEEQASKYTVLEELLTMLYSCDSEYVFLLHKDIELLHDIDVQEGACMLNKTHAYGVYYSLGSDVHECKYLSCEQPIPHLIELENDWCAWQFSDANGMWHVPHSCDAVLLRRSHLIAHFSALAGNSIEEIVHAWQLIPYDTNALGLCKKEAAATVISMNEKGPAFSGDNL